MWTQKDPKWIDMKQEKKKKKPAKYVTLNVNWLVLTYLIWSPQPLLTTSPNYPFTRTFIQGLISVSKCFTPSIHTPMVVSEQLDVQSLAKKPVIKPPSFWLVDDLLYLLNQCLTFWVTDPFAFSLTVRWQDWSHFKPFHTCLYNNKERLELEDNDVSLA